MSEKKKKHELKLLRYDHNDLGREVKSIADTYEVSPLDLMNWIVADWLMTFNIANDTYNPEHKNNGAAFYAFLSSVEKHQKEFEVYLEKSKSKS